MAPSKGNFSKGGNGKRKNKSKSAKQRIRSIKRLLSKPDLPATVRVSQERMLDLMQNTLEEEQQSKKDAKMIKKYKMVKFFEKRKLWRQQRAVSKEVKDSPDPGSSVNRTAQLEEIQRKILRDINYVEYFPSDRKYISLFPAQPYTNGNIINEQEELYKYINEKVDAGELPQATFNKFVRHKSTTTRSKAKGNISKLNKHMDKRNRVNDKSDTNRKSHLTPSLDGDDFFIDTSGDTTLTD